MNAATGTGCPICGAPLPEGQVACPSCGLPRDLWPAEGALLEGGPDVRFEEVFKELMARSAGVEADLLAEAVPGRDLIPSGQGGPAPLPAPKRSASGPSGDPDPGARDALEKRILALLQIGRRSSLDVRRFERRLDELRAGDLRASDPREAGEGLERTLRDFLQTELERRLEDVARRRGVLQRFLGSPPQPDDDLRKGLARLDRGDLAEAQRSLRRAEGEVARLEETLGPLATLWDRVDRLREEVEGMGGNVATARSLMDEALEGAATRGRSYSEEQLNLALASLLEGVGPLLAKELLRMSRILRGQLARGRDVRPAAALIRQMTRLLQEHSYYRAARLLGKLRAQIHEDPSLEDPGAREREPTGPRSRSPS